MGTMKEFKTQICTTIEQSKRLLDLGLKPETADCTWAIINGEPVAFIGQIIYPYAQPYRDPDNPHRPIPQWQKDMAHWVNKHQIFQTTDFSGFSPRKGFRCEEYIKQFIK